jgi:hypothetical protein
MWTEGLSTLGKVPCTSDVSSEQPLLCNVPFVSFPSFISEVRTSWVITCIADGRFFGATLPLPLQIVSVWAIFICSLSNVFCFSQFRKYPVNISVTSTVTILNKIKNNIITAVHALPGLLTTYKISQQNCQSFRNKSVSCLKAKRETKSVSSIGT